MHTKNSEIVSIGSDPASTSKKKGDNYLRELRMKREAMEKRSLQNSSGTVGPITKNELQLNRLTSDNRLSDFQKQDAIKRHAR